ncbi:thioredoxin family protein [Anaerobacillus sp. CMMVII]|uniref:thioredoxin family protein n=1 Tax=Anaerobacillus sp. CMMVII TaxID=2755588 RepID=UPI0037BFB2CF
MCLQLEKVVFAAVNELGIKATVKKITDLEEIVNYGVFAIPTVSNEWSYKGKWSVIKQKEIMKWLKELI